MLKEICNRFGALMLCIIIVCSLLPTTVFSADESMEFPVDGLGVTYTSGDTIVWQADGNNITGSVTALKGCSTTAVSTTLTFKNQRSNEAQLRFDYEVTLEGGTLEINGESKTENGSFSANVSAAGTVSVSIQSSSDENNKTTVVLKNVQLIDLSATPDVTFLPVANGGSYTVDGVEITAEITKSKKSTEAYTLVATPASGYSFFGWYSVTGSKYLSSDATASLNFDTDQTIKPVFIDASLAIFETGGVRFYDLNEANTYAEANGHDKIVVVSDGTLPAGEYTISAKVTLVIPFDSTNAYYTTAPAYTTTASAPTAYRTLTVAPGASIAVDGAISVGAKHYTSSQAKNGNPTGAYGYIKMQEGSCITVKDGGVLYAWGYISGSGHITAESGASVYEYFQIADWRGGSATSGMNGKKEKVFPFSQYYVQNIEAPLTLNYGAT